MKIELLDLTVHELVKSYDDAGEDGVTGYGGRLDIRPPLPVPWYRRIFGSPTQK